MKLKNIKSFYDYFEANVVCQRMQSEGINAFLFDEQSNTIQPFFAMATGGIKLMVPLNELILAENILKEIDSTQT